MYLTLVSRYRLQARTCTHASFRQITTSVVTKGRRTVRVKFCEGPRAWAHCTPAHLGGCPHDERGLSQEFEDSIRSTYEETIKVLSSGCSVFFLLVIFSEFSSTSFLRQIGFIQQQLIVSCSGGR